MWKWVGLTVAATVAAMTLGCSQQSGTAVVIEEETVNFTVSIGGQ